MAVRSNPLRVTVIGPCASGKSTLVRALRLHGYDASVTSQEHSVVPTLWKRQQPDILIALQADLESIRIRRRNPRWRLDVWKSQQERLADAFDHADLVSDTSDRTVNEVVEQVLHFLIEQGNVDPDES